MFVLDSNPQTQRTLNLVPNLNVTLSLNLIPTHTSQAHLLGKWQEEIGKLNASHIVKEVCRETQTQTQTLPQTPSLYQTLTLSLCREDESFQLRATYVGKEVCNPTPNTHPYCNPILNPHLYPS
jgi:hypothetical protein